VVAAVMDMTDSLAQPVQVVGVLALPGEVQ
jgi:hypothetical protein